MSGVFVVALALSVPVGVLGTTPPAAAATVPPAAAATVPPARQVDLLPAGDDDSVGRWRVLDHADGSYTLRWTSPATLPVTDDRPVFELAGQPYAVPELHADGSTLSVTVPATANAAAPDPEDLDVVLSGRTLDAPARASAAPSGQSVVSPLPGTQSLTPDPGVPGSHPTASDNYRLPGVRMQGMPARIEMLGHVVYPTDVATGAAPLVLFLHGRHEACYRTPGGTGSGDRDWPCRRGTSPVPSHLGYRYVQRLLAGQGYVTVSIAANGINAQDWRLVDGGAAARGRLVREHLDAWADPAATPRIGPAAGLVDLDDVVLVGHSRGGEGVNRASAEIALTAPYRVAGQILIGPTDFGRQTAPYVPTVTVLPSCDGDVSDLQGQAFTDLARDYVPDDTALHSSLLVMGANHNFFNTEWTPGLSVAPSFDDWFGKPAATCGTRSPSRLTDTEQRAVGRSYIAGAVRLMADGDDAMLPLFDGSRVSLASAGDTDVRSHAVGLDRSARAPGHGASLAIRSPAPASARICVGRAGPSRHESWCGRGTSSARTPHWPGFFPAGAPAQRAFEMEWDGTGQRAGLRFGQVLDVSGGALHLRTIADPAEGRAHLRVRVIDVTGNAAEVGVRPVHPLPKGPFVLGKRWAQDVEIDATELSTANPALDLTAVREVDLVSHDAHGRVWVLDVAAGTDVLPTPPVRRTGRLSLHDLTIREGDGTRVRHAQLRFHISGDVSRPTHFRLASAGFFGLRFGRPIDVTVSAGLHDGTVNVPFRPNRRDDLRRRIFDVAAYGVSGAMPTDYTARLVIVDDDPRPTMTLTARRSPIREGWTARWTMRLSRAINYFDTAFVVVRPGPRRTPGLRIDDLPPAWVRQHSDRTRPHQPLDQAPLFLAASVRPGQRTLTITIPVRRDLKREGLEHVTLAVRLFQAHVRDVRTIQVRDALPR